MKEHLRTLLPTLVLLALPLGLSWMVHASASAVVARQTPADPVGLRAALPPAQAEAPSVEPTMRERKPADNGARSIGP